MVIPFHGAFVLHIADGGIFFKCQPVFRTALLSRLARLNPFVTEKTTES